MTQTYAELIVGGVLITPVVRFAVMALLLFVLLRPLLHFLRFAGLFSNPPLAELCLFISIFGLLAIFS